MRLHLTQERIDLHAELVRITNGPDPDLSSYEKDFVRVAKQYGDLAGVTYAAWRQVGVDTEVLEQAGIQRTAPARPDASRVRRTTETTPDTDGDTAPLLPRTEATPAPVVEPVVEPPAVEAPVAEEPAPVPATPAVAPELALEPPAAPKAAKAPAPAQPAKAPAPAQPAKAAKPRPPKKPRAAAAGDAAPQAVPADADSTPPHGDRVPRDEQPKLRRKRIAD